MEKIKIQNPYSSLLVEQHVIEPNKIVIHVFNDDDDVSLNTSSSIMLDYSQLCYLRDHLNFVLDKISPPHPKKIPAAD